MEKKLQHKPEEYVDFVVTARKYKTLLTEKYKNRSVWHKPVAGEVISHLPGTIIQIMVEVGQPVEAGQLLLIHEAMKMQNRVSCLRVYKRASGKGCGLINPLLYKLKNSKTEDLIAGLFLTAKIIYLHLLPFKS